MLFTLFIIALLLWKRPLPPYQHIPKTTHSRRKNTHIFSSHFLHLVECAPHIFLFVIIFTVLNFEFGIFHSRFLNNIQIKLRCRCRRRRRAPYVRSVSCTRPARKYSARVIKLIVSGRSRRRRRRRDHCTVSVCVENNNFCCYDSACVFLCK